MATYFVVPPFRRAKFFGVHLRAIVNVWCSVGKDGLRNSVLDYTELTNL
jgi:hypothetical protein